MRRKEETAADKLELIHLHMISVADQFPTLADQLRSLQGGAPMPVFPYKVRIISFFLCDLRVCKIKDICASFMHQYVRMRSDPAVIPAQSRFPQDIGASLPMYRVFTDIHPKPMPGICEHPVSFPEEKYIGPLVGTIRNLRAAGGPMIQIRAERAVSKSLICLIFVPHLPASVRQPDDTGINHPVRGQLRFSGKCPVPQILTRIMEYFSWIFPAERNPAHIGYIHVK